MAGPLLFGLRSYWSAFTLGKAKRQRQGYGVKSRPEDYQLCFTRSPIRRLLNGRYVQLIDTVLTSLVKAEGGFSFAAWPLDPAVFDGVVTLVINFLEDLLRDDDSNQAQDEELIHALETWQLIRCLFCKLDDTSKPESPQSKERRSSVVSEAEMELAVFPFKMEEEASEGSVSGEEGEEEEEEGMQEEESISDVTEFEKIGEKNRRLQCFEIWLRSANERHICKVLKNGKPSVKGVGNESVETLLETSTKDRLQKAFVYLTANKVREAILQLIGDNNTSKGQSFIRLALCLAAAGGSSLCSAPALVRSYQYEQLRSWQQRKVYETCPLELLRINHLLAGVADRLVASATTHWRSFFALLLWYPSPDLSLPNGETVVKPARRASLRSSTEAHSSPFLASSLRANFSAISSARFSTGRRRAYADDDLTLSATAFPRSSASPSFSGLRSQSFSHLFCEASPSLAVNSVSMRPSHALERALHRYLSFLESEEIPSPSPFWKSKIDDVQFSLLRLFIEDRDFDAISIFEPLANSSDALNYFQPWLLLKTLGPLLPPQIATPSPLNLVALKVQDGLCAQLEDTSLWYHVPAILLMTKSITQLHDSLIVKLIADCLRRNLILYNSNFYHNSNSSNYCNDNNGSNSNNIRLGSLTECRSHLFYISQCLGVPNLVLWHCIAETQDSIEACDAWLETTTLSLVSNDIHPSNERPSSLFNSVIPDSSFDSLIGHSFLMTPTSNLFYAANSLLHSHRFLTALHTLSKRLIGTRDFLWNALSLEDDPNTQEEEVSVLNQDFFNELYNSLLSTQGPLPIKPTPHRASELLELAFGDTPFERRQRLDFDGRRMFRRTVPEMCAEIMGQAKALTQPAALEESPLLVICCFVVWISRVLQLHDAVLTKTMRSSADQEEGSFLRDLAEHLFTVITKQLEMTQRRRKELKSVSLSDDYCILPYLNPRSSLPLPLIVLTGPLLKITLDIQRLLTGCLHGAHERKFSKKKK